MTWSPIMILPSRTDFAACSTTDPARTGQSADPDGRCGGQCAGRYSGGEMVVSVFPARGIQLGLQEKDAAGEIGTGQVGVPQVGADQVGHSQVGAAEIGADEVGAAQIRRPQVGAAQIGADQVGAAVFLADLSCFAFVAFARCSLDSLVLWTGRCVIGRVRWCAAAAR